MAGPPPPPIWGVHTSPEVQTMTMTVSAEEEREA